MSCQANCHKTIYDFTVKDADGKDVSLSKYKGQVVIIINVASECTTTDFNYKALKELHDKYHAKGLRIAAFPCNQFLGEEPSCETDVKKFVMNKFHFEPDIYAKIDVNGESADHLWRWLKKEQEGVLVDAIKWNFTKFLVDRKGYVVNRYAPTTPPTSFEEDIKTLLLKEA